MTERLTTYKERKMSKPTKSRSRERRSVRLTLDELDLLYGEMQTNVDTGPDDDLQAAYQRLADKFLRAIQRR